MADLVVSHDPRASLRTLPLGAGLAVAIYDPIAKVGGLLHSLLPTSVLDPQFAVRRPGMFLDTGLAALLGRALQFKAGKENLHICVAGAAQIMDQTTLFDIGPRNYKRLTELLAVEGLKIDAEDVGGKTSCSMELILATGEVRVKFSGQRIARTLCKPLKTI